MSYKIKFSSGSGSHCDSGLFPELKIVLRTFSSILALVIINIQEASCISPLFMTRAITR